MPATDFPPLPDLPDPPDREPGRTPDAALRAAFEAVPRAGFLPASQRGFAGEDRALPIGHEQTNSQPSTVREMLALLNVRPGQQVLDVGSGSGWTTALLAHLVGPTGRVYAVEVVPALVEQSRAVLAELDLPQVEVAQARADVLGLPDQAPFDRVLVSAEAGELPQELVRQLGPGGVLVVPVRGTMTRLEVVPGSDQPRVTRHGMYAFVPLHEPPRPPHQHKP